MKGVFAALAACVLAAGLVLAETPALKSQQQKLSYAIGLSVGRNLKSQDITVEPEVFLLGLRTAMEDSKPLLSDEELKAAVAAFQAERRQHQLEAANRQGAENKKAGEAFLAANKKKKGVKTTKSGLQYKVLKAGSGASPTPENRVLAHYRGTLIDGKEFDSSYSRGEPAEFPVKGVIAGWTEVLQLMQVGAKYQVWIPSQLAYGEHGPSELIGAHSALIFEIELLEVK